MHAISEAHTAHTQHTHHEEEKENFNNYLTPTTIPCLVVSTHSFYFYALHHTF